MNKAELISAIAAESGLSKADSKKALEAFVSCVSQSLKDGDKVSLIGFGTFSVKRRDARVGRNPRTGEQVTVEEKAAPFFRMGKEMREKLNN